MDRKRQQFWDAVRGDPWDFADRVAERLLAATLAYVPLDRVGEASRPWSLWLKRLTHPLPFLSLLVLVFARWQRVSPVQWITIGVYIAYLLPYVVVSYYERYAVPLLGVKALLVTWAVGLVGEFTLSISSPTALTLGQNLNNVGSATCRGSNSN